MDALPKKRIDWIDMAKGYGMILVIYGHIIFSSNSLPLYMIFSFHMPLFFFLSGYVFSNRRPFNDFIRNKEKTLLLPVFGYGSVIIIFMLLFYRPTNISDFFIANIIRLLLQYRFVSLWFLSSLFVVDFIFYALLSTKRYPISIKVSLVVITGIFYYYFGGQALAYSVDTAPIALIFFYAGYIFKQKNLAENIKILKYRPLLFPLALVLFCLGNYYIFYGGYKFFDMNTCTYPLPLLSIIDAFLGIYLLIIISQLFNIKIIKYIGKNTIIFLGLHNFVIMPVLQLYIDNDLLLLLCTTMTILVLCYIKNFIKDKIILMYSASNKIHHLDTLNDIQK